jgi:hypothetical protein
MEALTRAGWEDTGIYLTEKPLIPFILYGQLADVRYMNTGGAYHLWTPTIDRERTERLPAILTSDAPEAAFTPVERTLPPPHFGKRAVILQEKLIPCSVNKLPLASQELQARLGAALDQLASTPDLPAAIWIAAWREIQQMARQLAADYWRKFQDTQVERPKPVNVWTDNHALAPLTMITEGAHISINHKAGWEKEGHMIDKDGPLQGLKVPGYTYATGKNRENSTLYWMEPPEDAEAIDPELALQEVLQHLEARTDRDGDVYMLAPVYALAKGLQEVTLTPEQLLKDLSIQPKVKDGYSAGFRPEERQAVIEAFERAAWLQIKTRQWIQRRRGVQPHLLTAESPYLLITERIWQEPLDDETPRRLIGWKFRMHWLEKFISGDENAAHQLGILLKRVLAYGMNQPWEKRLAKYFIIHLCIAAHAGEMKVRFAIRNILGYLGLLPTERDKKRPAEYRQQFERAMDHLKADGIIGDWKLSVQETDLPARGWLDIWLDSSLWITQAPETLIAGYQKMINAAQERKECAKTAQLVIGKRSVAKEKHSGT